MTDAVGAVTAVSAVVVGADVAVRPTAVAATVAVVTSLLNGSGAEKEKIDAEFIGGFALPTVDVNPF